MQISASLIRPIGQAVVDQQASSDRRPTGSGQVVANPPGTAVSNLTLRAVADAKQAEAMLFRKRFEQPAQQTGEIAGSRSQRALAAYASLDQSAEREYVSSVLGIDEYV